MTFSIDKRNFRFLIMCTLLVWIVFCSVLSTGSGRIMSPASMGGVRINPLTEYTSNENLLTPLESQAVTIAHKDDGKIQLPVVREISGWVVKVWNNVLSNRAG